MCSLPNTGDVSVDTDRYLAFERRDRAVIGQISAIESRPVTRGDVSALWSIRYSANENMLTPGRISDAELMAAFEGIGRGWVANCDSRAARFPLELFDGQVRALYVRPHFQARGLGAALNSRLLAWFVSQRSASG